MTRYIDRKKTIARYKEEHERLKKFVLSLPDEQVLKPKTLGDWSIKDVITHLAAWNWEAIDEVDRVLKDRATWPAQYEGKTGEDEFNRRAVEKRRNMSWQDVMKDWDDSFWKQIERMESISEDEWKHQSGDQVWSDGTSVTVYSLFDYMYEGEGHEGGHAIQIKRLISK